jgi:2-polyprenyl-6-methoxyphenol hydroxylase-like FAD-dependent oxidoreductase
MVTIDRGDYYQCGYIIRKGAFDAIKRRGLDAFRDGIVSVAPFLRDTVHEIDNWDEVKLLTVQVNRLRSWYRPGLLFIGDAAHAMSPAGGVGINLAVQDAVAAANLLASKLRSRTLTTDDLAKVQQRREWPTRVIQSVQVFIHRRMFASGSNPDEALSFSRPARFVLRLLTPLLRRIGARVIGVGVVPEHIHTSSA